MESVRQTVDFKAEPTTAELAELQDIRLARWRAARRRARMEVLVSEHKQTLLHMAGNPLALTGRHRKNTTWRSRWKRTSGARPRHLAPPNRPQHQATPEAKGWQVVLAALATVTD